LAKIAWRPLRQFAGYSSKSQVQLERKEDMKARGMASPDLGDCPAVSLSVTVQPKPQRRPVRSPGYLSPWA